MDLSVQRGRRLFGNKGKAFDTPDNIHSVDGINSAETIALLKQIKPDAILVYGTSVVKDTVLSLARDICFNMHNGICPYYRGTGCDFWPIVNGDFEMIGATVHQCTSQIDGGSIFEIAHVTYESGDDLYALAGRTLVAGTQAYVRVVDRYLAGKLQGMPQDLSFGREYRSSDLTLGPELTGRLRMRRMRRNARHRFMPAAGRAERPKPRSTVVTSVAGKRSDAVLQTAMPGHDRLNKARSKPTPTPEAAAGI